LRFISANSIGRQPDDTHAFNKRCIPIRQSSQPPILLCTSKLGSGVVCLSYVHKSATDLVSVKV